MGKGVQKIALLNEEKIAIFHISHPWRELRKVVGKFVADTGNAYSVSSKKLNKLLDKRFSV